MPPKGSSGALSDGFLFEREEPFPCTAKGAIKGQVDVFEAAIFAADTTVSNQQKRRWIRHAGVASRAEGRSARTNDRVSW